MTVLHPGVRRRARVRTLGDGDRPALAGLLAADPFVNVVLDARIEAVGTLRPHRLGGLLSGVFEGEDLVGASFHGGNLLAVGGDEPTWAALARHALSQPRVATSIVGRAEAIDVMWPILAPAWGPARAWRDRQPLLVSRGMPDCAFDTDVRPAGPAELERYVPAAAAMFAEELGISPHVAPGTTAFRARVSELIGGGRALARYDQRGQVMFKAEIGAVSRHSAQVQGVWVRPHLRRRGLGTAAMAAVLRYAHGLAPSVSLYVNDFNQAGRRLYARLGMDEVGALATVLL